MLEVSNDEGALDKPPNKIRKKSGKPAQKFSIKWLEMAEFKNWLQKVQTNVYRARCKYCNQELTADISVLKAHLKTQKHQDAEKAKNIPKQQQMSHFLSKEPLTSSTLEIQTKMAEIKIAGFLAEHHVSFNVLEHLPGLLKSAFPDSKIAENITLKRSKGSAVVRNVIGETENDYLARELTTSKFSILTDESTDISSTKSSCILVRYFDGQQNKVISAFWDLRQVYANDGSVTSANAEHLYTGIITSLTEKSILLDNVIGFASDGCNVMMGEHNSVASRFRENFNGIFILKCVCHSLALCASEACRQLPRSAEDLARNIFNFFHASSKRLTAFQQFQVFTDTEVHKMLQPAQTRWLSLSIVVDRVLEQWAP